MNIDECPQAVAQLARDMDVWERECMTLSLKYTQKKKKNVDEKIC